MSHLECHLAHAAKTWVLFIDSQRAKDRLEFLKQLSVDDVRTWSVHAATQVAIGLNNNKKVEALAPIRKLRLYIYVGQECVYMSLRPQTTSTDCAESSGTVVAPGDHTSREHGAGRGTAQ